MTWHIDEKPGLDLTKQTVQYSQGLFKESFMFKKASVLIAIFLGAFSYLSQGPSCLADAPAINPNPEIKYTMPSGDTFTAPTGWEVQPKGKLFVIRDPEKLVTIVFTENQEMSPQDAIMTAWKSYNPDFSSAVMRKAFPKSEKWDQVCRQWYYVPSEQDPMKSSMTRGLYAIARQKNNHWYVGLMDYDIASADKRQSQINLIFSSLVLAGVVLTPTPTPYAVQMDDKFYKTFEDFVENARNNCKVPGAAVAIVKDGKVVYAKGFGVCEKDKKDPVTTKTLFSIASMTKPLTTLLMACLVDAGKISWDTPVTQILPSFQLGDPKTTDELTMKYTVCACAGLPRQDMEMIFPTGFNSPDLVFEKIRRMSPTTGFGETFQYSNIMVAVGGFTAAHVVHPELPFGAAYETAMKEYIFDPLGM